MPTDELLASKLECTIPMLPVTNLSHSIAFYTEKLGFTLDWKSEGTAVFHVTNIPSCCDKQPRNLPVGSGSA